MNQLSNLQKELILTYAKVAKKVDENKLVFWHISFESTADRKEFKNKFRKFLANPTRENFGEFWNKQYIYSAMMKGLAKNLFKKHNINTIHKIFTEINGSDQYNDKWEKELGAKSTLREFWGKIKEKPIQNGCAETGLIFFGYKRPKNYADFLEKFNEFKEEYLKILGKQATSNPIIFELDKMFNFIDKADSSDLEYEEMPKDGDLYKLYELKMRTDSGKIIDPPIKNYWLIAPGEGAKMWDEFSRDGLIGIGWDVGDLRKHDNKSLKKSFIEIYGKSSFRGTPYRNNIQTCLDFAKVMKVGDVLFAKKGQTKIVGYGIVTSDYIFDESRDEYKNIRKVNWIKKGEWEITRKKFPIITLTNITNDKEYIRELEKLINVKMNPMTTKNLILYGPPGTGKTYKALKMAEDLLSKQAKEESREEKIAKIISDLKWFEVIGIVMKLRDKDKYKIGSLREDEVINTYFSKIKNRSERISNTLWSTLQQHADVSSQTVKYVNKTGTNLFDKDEHSNWFLTDTGKEYFSSNEYKEVSDQLINIKTDKKDWREFYKFITFHQSYSYEEFIEGIRPVLDSESETVKYELKNGIFKEMCLRAEADPGNNYLLIIDEINRGNISKIFGELITLIEDDKRLGAKNVIKATLPYSGKQFSVPQNLYLIGTMNTADRSIALLDIALRRRFVFEEILPDYNLLAGLTIGGLNISDLLKSLNQKLEIMIDRDHKIGHSYFMKINGSENKEEKLHSVWYHEVVPLLQEYFYNDWEKMKQLLGEYKEAEGTGFIKIKSESEISNTFNESEIDNYSEIVVGNVYEYGENKLIGALSDLV